MPYNSGFRVFNLKWVVSSIDTAGSTYDNDDPESGKIINSNGTFGYTDDKWGVKRCLEDFCAPLYTTSLNGNGWQLDTDLCPDSEAILLKPNNRVYVLFFKHTSGARLMMGLNYFGMVSTTAEPSVDPPVYSSSSNRYYDVGFLSKWTNHLRPLTDPAYSNSSSYTCYGGGLFMSMIPPANSGETQDVFHPDISIRDIAFYPQSMTPVQYQKLSYAYSPYIVTMNDYLAPCTSFIKQGTNDSSKDIATSYSSGKQRGVVVGANIGLSLLVCEEVIGFTGKYRDINLGRHFCGRILSDCRQPDDTLSTSEYAELANIAGSNSSSYVYLWDISYNYYQCCRCCNTTGTNWPNMYTSYSTNGYVDTPLTYEYIYAGYVYGNNSEMPISTNNQTKAKLRSDLFRFTAISSNKTIGQTYNDGLWCYYGTTDYSSSTFVDSCSATSTLFIKWDGNANGTDTFICS